MNSKLLVVFALFASVAFSQNLIFVTNQVFTADSGLAAFDSACWTEANNQLGDEFVAVVSTAADDARDRIEDTGTYINANGLPVANSLAALFPDGASSSYTIQNAIVEQDGTASSIFAWTGSASMNSAFVLSLSCDSFTDLTPSSGLFGISGTANKVGPGWWTNTFSECVSASNAVYCAAKRGGSIIQDPIFHGFDGSRFEFQGIANQIFNLISSSNFNLNAKFIGIEHGTFMSTLGFKIGNHEIYVDANSTVVVDGEYLKESIKTDDYEIAIKNFGKFIIVEGNGWSVNIKVVASNRLDLTFYSDLSVIVGDVNGVIGQTLNGEGEFNLEVSDFLVSGGLFSTDFVVNVFGNNVVESHALKRSFQDILKATYF